MKWKSGKGRTQAHSLLVYTYTILTTKTRRQNDGNLIIITLLLHYYS